MSPSERAKADAKRYAVRFSTDAPTRQVRPGLPNNFDATQGSTASPSQYQANNAAMYSLAPVPPMAKPVARGWENPVSDVAGIAARYGAPAQSTAQPPVYAGPPRPPGIPSVDEPGGQGDWQTGDDRELYGPPAPKDGWFQRAQRDASQRASSMGPPPQAQNAQTRWSSGAPSTQRYYERKDIRDSRNRDIHPDVRRDARRFNSKPGAEQYSAY